MRAIEDITGWKIQPAADHTIAGQIKNLIEQVYCGDFLFPPDFSFYYYAHSILNYDFDTWNTAFYSAFEKTVEQYRSEYRVNKLKELLVYTSLPLSEIACRLDFRDTEQMSALLNQQTGLTVSFFKRIKMERESIIKQAQRDKEAEKSPIL